MDKQGLSAHEIYDAFPDECKEYVPKELSELYLKTIKIKRALRDIEISDYTDEQKKLLTMIISNLIPKDINEKIEKYKKINKLIAEEKDSSDEYLKDKHALMKAKAYPIENITQLEKRRDSATRISACCPLHNENKPSFVIYKSTNTFNCFSCHENGDSVSFYMKINKTTFKEAVKELSRWNI